MDIRAVQSNFNRIIPMNFLNPRMEFVYNMKRSLDYTFDRRKNQRSHYVC